MTKYLARALGVLAFAFATPAHASDTISGTVYGILPNTAARVFFNHTGSNVGTPPACATNPRWAIDVSTDSGRAIYAALLTAYAAGKQVQVFGTGNCALWGDSQGVSYIIMF